MIQIEQLHARAGQFAIRDVNLAVPQGCYAVLMGRTGSGKTTLLESICGLRQIVSGRIRIGDRDVSDLKPGERGIGLVPQDVALFPTMTVRQHLAFALEIRRRPPDAIADRVEELASLLGIAHLLDRYTAGLSGGESQRVALGRALSFRPGVLLLDEPLSALDEATRDEMHALLRDVQRTTGVTTLHITHNRSEGRALAQKLFVAEANTVREAPLEELAKRC
ncbi:MAG: ABC transporter ATP-binding protein [Verrucomicrobiae bacterium]|nr:ABC transporter ATP-binding protein [Verrucomicrobiae bacterium]